MIDFFSNDDLKTLLDIIQSNGRPPAGGPNDALNKFEEANPISQEEKVATIDDRSPIEISKEEGSDEEMYSVKNFSI